VIRISASDIRDQEFFGFQVELGDRIDTPLEIDAFGSAESVNENPSGSQDI